MVHNGQTIQQTPVNLYYVTWLMRSRNLLSNFSTKISVFQYLSNLILFFFIVHSPSQSGPRSFICRSSYSLLRSFPVDAVSRYILKSITEYQEYSVTEPWFLLLSPIVFALALRKQSCVFIIVGSLSTYIGLFQLIRVIYSLCLGALSYFFSVKFWSTNKL